MQIKTAFSALGLGASLLLSACTGSTQATLQPSVLQQLSSGVYQAYVAPTSVEVSDAPAGYEAFYLSTYNRHGSRYQPSDKRYVNTLRRLQEGHEQGVLTEQGEALLPQIQLLCDSCLGHGGLLTTVGEKQLAGIGSRLATRYPQCFANGRFVSARASVVPRCGASMRAFMQGVTQTLGFELNGLQEVDSAYMSYIAYDSPAMRQLSAKDASWYPEFQRFYREHTLLTSVVNRFFTDATRLDSLDFVDDLYWLTIGMQNVEVPGCDLSGCFTPEELFECYRCVNYRMYICNSLSPTGHDIPAKSASSLLLNIVKSADQAIAHPAEIGAHLRFGHDSNLLRLLALMRVQGCTARVDDPAQAWQVWQEAVLCPMGANLQMVFYKPEGSSLSGSETSSISDSEAEAHGACPVYVQFFLNEIPTSLDVAALQPHEGNLYLWSDVKSFFLSQIDTHQQETEFIEPVQ